jgi:flavin reductase (DIM6/NTAB) family NADH-FMN oxidoreductase RutF
MPGSPAAVDLRRAMAHLAGGVAVVTAISTAGEPRGATITALCSLSVDPPLLLVCLATDSDTGEALERGAPFLVNLLAEGQADVASALATKHPDKFAAVDWAAGVDGLPELVGTAGSIWCSTVERSWGGDHHIIIGAVGRSTVAVDRRPLLYWRRQFGSFAAAPAAVR